MSSNNFIVNYNLCRSCKKAMASGGNKLCKSCKPKREYNRTLNKSTSKRYLNMFETKSSLNNKGALDESKVSVLVFHSSKFRINKEIAPPKITREHPQFFHLYWDKFNDFDSFSRFIAKSVQISFTYFTLNSLEIQQKPKFRYFIKCREHKLPVVYPSIQRLLSIPISRPLYLLTQNSYWDGLMKNYFYHVHTILPVFSIHSFDPITADKSLLSAIYFAGFHFIQEKPPELISYFNNYSKLNVTQAIRKFFLQSAQALNIYGFIFAINGEFTLSRYCQSHAIRISYALGLHINLKRIKPVQRYNRLKLFSCVFTLHISIYGVGYFPLNQLTEFEDYDIELLEPEYQVPNSNCAFYFDTQDENKVYGYCTDTFSKAYYMFIRSLWRVNKFSESYIQAEFDNIFNNITQKYLEDLNVYNILSQKYPHLKANIQNFKLQLFLIYCATKCDAYKILRSKNKTLKPKQISKIISECCKLFDLVIESEQLTHVVHTYPYIAGLNIINLYSISDSFQRTLIKQKLGEILDFLSKETYVDKLSYLIIKNEYESIIKSEDKSSN